MRRSPIALPINLVALTALTTLAPTTASAAITNFSTFGTALGLGNTINGFTLSGSTDLEFNGGARAFNIGVTPNTTLVTASATLQKSDLFDSFTIRFDSFDGTSSLFPTGFNDGTANLDRGGHFLGANAGLTPIQTDGSEGNWLGLEYELFNSNGNSIGILTVDVLDQPFNGSFGVDLGQINTLGVTGLEVRGIVGNVPAPSAPIALGLAAIRRRRR